MTFSWDWSIEYPKSAQKIIKIQAISMYPGTASTTVALNPRVHENVIPFVTRDAPAHKDERWIHAALDRPLQFGLKRAMDVVISSLSLVVLLPFFVAIAAMIVYENRGPVFFSQMR